MWPQSRIELVGGPHGIPASVVAGVQRERLLKAVTEVVTRDGYAATTVGGVLTQSGLSRRTFYDLYVDKEDAYLAAFHEVAGKLEELFAAGFDSGESADERIRRAVEAIAGFCVEEPDAACACLVESLAAGQTGREARNRLIERLAERLVPALAELRPINPHPTLVAWATVGGVFELLYGPLARRDVARLRDLATQIGELPLVPAATR